MRMWVWPASGHHGAKLEDTRSEKEQNKPIKTKILMLFCKEKARNLFHLQPKCKGHFKLGPHYRKNRKDESNINGISRNQDKCEQIVPSQPMLPKEKGKL